MKIAVEDNGGNVRTYELHMADSINGWCHGEDHECAGELFTWTVPMQDGADEFNGGVWIVCRAGIELPESQSRIIEDDWKAPGAMREWTYTVPYTVIKHKTVTVIADREPQATSNMLAAMLDAGLDAQTGWKLESTRTLASVGDLGDETKLMRPITIKGYND